MKLVIAIVQDKDSDQLSNQFIEHDVRATKLASSGSFLRSGNSTFLIGIDDQRIDERARNYKACLEEAAEVYYPASWSRHARLKGCIIIIRAKSALAAQRFLSSMLLNLNSIDLMEESWSRRSQQFNHN